MQERRTTVRVPCLVNAHYRLVPSEDAPSAAAIEIPSRLTNLSQRGAGLRSPNRLSAGQRLMVRFALPHERQDITVNGRVRWIDAPSGASHHWAAGLAFDQLDDTTQFCVNEFVADRAAHLGAQDAWFASWIHRLRLRLSLAPIRQLYALSILALMTGLLLAVVVTQQSAVRLRENLADRARVIQQLETHHQLLLINFHETQRDVETLSRQLSELKAYSSEIEARTMAIADQLEQTRQEYLRLTDDRERMRQELAALQARQATLEARLQSLPDLRQAMVDVMQLNRRQARQAHQAQLRLQDRQGLASGNRGYLVRRPPPSGGTPAVSITVYPPEAVGPAAGGTPSVAGPAAGGTPDATTAPAYGP